MEKIQLGNTPLTTSPIVFGGNVFGWTLNEKESFKMLDEIFERGFDTIDTADVYSRWAEGVEGGTSERIIGKWMKERKVRDKITLITKVGSSMQQGGDKNISKDYILKASEDSLKRLQTDYIDLYFTHYDDNKTPVEETLEAYQQLIDEGKVRNIGASNMSAERLQESLNAAKNNNLPKYKVFQPEYSLAERSKFEGVIKDICLENNLGVIPYFSLASGFLTGKYRKEADLEGQDRKDMVKAYFNKKGLKIISTMDEISRNHEVSNAGVALAWLIQRPGITAPIASATKSSHLKSFQEAVNLKLSEEEMQRLNEVSE
ncbi:NADP-dependent aryl-alcohol dehydrogenase [Salinimicrobium marinum]|uniref:NADP-dependent aryl-alcohol dehydrogenase n=1 Tax=Salinimicrobium marinum TaxID=680283 RepID=A0A918VYB0_9FLAO|nr:aldo/keto reductase [Salinimicrobium marinum]GHA35173.1 NADP-dependent aryl-alcohol dehydrogenase [Salinimicrobium marinum]